MPGYLIGMRDVATGAVVATGAAVGPTLGLVAQSLVPVTMSTFGTVVAGVGASFGLGIVGHPANNQGYVNIARCRDRRSHCGIDWLRNLSATPLIIF